MTMLKGVYCTAFRIIIHRMVDTSSSEGRLFCDVDFRSVEGPCGTPDLRPACRGSLRVLDSVQPPPHSGTIVPREKRDRKG